MQKGTLARVTKTIWGHSFDEAKGLKRFLLLIFRVIYIVTIEFRKDAVTLRASALTFTVILSMVPFLAMGTAVLKGLGAGDKIREAAYAFIDQLAYQEAPIIPHENGTTTFSKHLKTMADTVFDYVDNTNFAALGAFGLVGMLFSVISLFGTIESAMNVIWRAASGRPFGRKVMDYLALLILLPFAVNVGLAVMAFLQSPKFVGILHRFFPAPWIGTLLLNLFMFSVIASTFTAMYRFLPNTKVPFIPALSGGVIGALGWIFTQAAYIKLQIGVAKYNAIYGSFATLPLFLLWLYAGWIVFLVGAEISYAVYALPRYRPGHDQALMPLERAALSVDILIEVFKDLANRSTPRLDHISKRLRIPEDQLESIVMALSKSKLLVVNNEDREVYPKGLPKDIEAFEAIDAVLGKETPDSIGGSLVKEARLGAKEKLKGKTIDTVL
ncbi:Inner membrane protein YihY [Dissulfuribacter thermophilus]|uniref:Inner membrane protein YihY n=1 Tax=Dissulfuribacter thermophilus TaxID=1156395 RepID=A0A1B9F6C1_9BACT|nr:YihY/virulence factor BrkB family protein [Dissulfuribacter thermophilus]OCC15487.1 Inner membrane protein YihY [Dissulfuribacter thermophilus]